MGIAHCSDRLYVVTMMSDEILVFNVGSTDNEHKTIIKVPGNVLALFSVIGVKGRSGQLYTNGMRPCSCCVYILGLHTQTSWHGTKQ